MKAVVFAYHDMGIAGLEALKKNGFEILSIFTHPDNSDENCWFGSVADWGRRNGIAVFSPEKINDPDWVSWIKDLKPEVIFSFYYRYLLSEEILAVPEMGAFNLHGSLLPAYRGRAPVNWVLVNGERETGVTLHYMVARADAGDIVGQRRVDIAYSDTAKTLFGKMIQAAAALLDDVLPLIRERRTPRTPQDLSRGSYFGRRRPEDGRIDWRRPSLKIYNLIRAVTEPYPGAFAFLPDGSKLMVWWALPEEISGDKALAGEPCGTVSIEDDYVLVRTGDGRIRLLDVELAGKRAVGTEITKILTPGVILK